MPDRAAPTAIRLIARLIKRAANAINLLRIRSRRALRTHVRRTRESAICADVIAITVARTLSRKNPPISRLFPLHPLSLSPCPTLPRRVERLLSLPRSAGRKVHELTCEHAEFFELLPRVFDACNSQTAKAASLSAPLFHAHYLGKVKFRRRRSSVYA